MPLAVCKDGSEATITEAVAYLERHYGIPAKDITAVAVEAKVGQPIRITVTLYQQSEPEPEVHLDHAGSDRWTGGDRKDAP
jgi:hypothetical protein